MAVKTREPELLALLHQKATRLRIDSIRATTEAGSGHPTSSVSSAEIVSVLFFHVMRYDPRNPGALGSDVFILSKGHAAPVLYAAWAEAGAFPREELLDLRKIGSNLEGHPTPRLPFVPVATGSLGQGLSAGVGMALNARRLENGPQRVYVLLGDGESAEGSVWEAAAIAAHYGLDNLCATVDINRLGQSAPTMYEHDVESYRARWTAFGWNAIAVDGHSVEELLDAYEAAQATSHRPTVILARTIKGKGIPEAENQPGHHGKALKRAAAGELVRQLERELNGGAGAWKPRIPAATPTRDRFAAHFPRELPAPPYRAGSDQVATRQAFGAALVAAGRLHPGIVVLDGDVKNSTHTEDFEKEFPDRFFQMYIAEQNMVGAAMGLAAAGRVPFVATFACFLTRASDLVRMAAIGGNNIKLAGSHAGVSIGEDGPSQMGLEDLAMFCAEPNFTVLYPSDAVSAWHATMLAAQVQGPVYIRTSRPKTPVIFEAGESFRIGSAKVIHQSDRDQVTVVAAGVTLFEALKARETLLQEGIPVRVIDLFSVSPIDQETLREAARITSRVITVEDHYAHGGIGDAVLSALAETPAKVRKLAVREIPRSGAPEELLERYGISAGSIVRAVHAMLQPE